jgi:CIC family chloride channel protein
VVTASQLRLLSEERVDAGWALAADVMQEAVTVRPEEDLRTAAERMVRSRLRVLPVVDADGHVIGHLDESDIARIYLRAAARADDTAEIKLPD